MSGRTAVMTAPQPSSGRDHALRTGRALGAAVGYGCLAVFLYLITMQVYHWFRDGGWTHVGVSDGLRLGLVRCCVNDGDVGRLARLVQWLDAPESWLGLHKVLEILPASLALFALSIAGNSVFLYCRDRIEQRAS